MTVPLRLGTGPAAQVRLLLFAAAFLPFLGLYAVKGTIWLSLAVALGLALLGRRGGAAFGPPVPWFLGLLAAVAVWAGLSLLWSVDRPRTLRYLPDLAAVLAGIACLLTARRGLDAEGRDKVGLALALGVALALAVSLFEFIFDAPLTRRVRVLDDPDNVNAILTLLNRGLSVIALLAWPAMIALLRRGQRRFAAALAALTLAILCTLYATASALAFLAGLAAAAAAIQFWRRNLAAALAMAAALWVLASPMAMGLAVNNLDYRTFLRLSDSISVPHRFEIWKFTTQKIAERPWTGYGFAAARSVPGAHDKVEVRTSRNSSMVDRLPLHPHNAPLEWWLELGLPLALMGAVLIGFTYRAAGRVAEPHTRALVLGQVTTGFVIANLSYGAWQSWWLATLAFAALMTLIQVAPHGRAGEADKR